jgi:hypothetical protein
MLEQGGMRRERGEKRGGRAAARRRNEQRRGREERCEPRKNQRKERASEQGRGSIEQTSPAESRYQGDYSGFAKCSKMLLPYL